MNSETLKKYGTAFVIEETLLKELNLGNIAGPVRPDFEIEELVTRVGATDSRRLVCTSLFNQTGQVSNGMWNYAAFNATVIPGLSPEKYWLPLLSRRRDFEGCRMRVYLAANLKNLVKPLLEEVGFDEVCVMSRPAQGFKTGMLWRYLALNETEWDHVFCTGIDRYSDKFRATMLEQCTSVTVSVWMNRHFLPLAGPISANPKGLQKLYGNVQMASALSGFLDAWERPRVGKDYVSKVFEYTGLSPLHAMPTIDACFLWYAFWNEKLISASPRLVSQVYFEYLKIQRVAFLLGAAA